MACCSKLQPNENAFLPKWKKLLFFFRDMILFLLHPRTRSKSERNHVLSICDKCPQRVGRWCGTCGCLLWLKAIGRIWHCPHNFWPGDKLFTPMRPHHRRCDMDLVKRLTGNAYVITTPCAKRHVTLLEDFSVGDGAIHAITFWSVMGNDIVLYTSTHKVWARLTEDNEHRLTGNTERGNTAVTMEKQNASSPTA